MIGVWIAGINGSVSATTIVGSIALRKGLTDSVGLLTETDGFEKVREEMPLDKKIKFGGHDVRALNAYEAAKFNYERNKYYSLDLLEKVKDDLLEIPVHKGTAIGGGKGVTNLGIDPLEARGLSLEEIVHTIENDILKFGEGIEDMVLVNLASTEPIAKPVPEFKAIERFESLIRGDKKESITASMLYAYIALKNNIPYINFTPSTGSDIPALCKLAEEAKTPHIGKDGKTGETLIKTALAPMFIYRALKIDGWFGSNILGNYDGKTLDNPENVKSKIKSKDSVLAKCLGYDTYSKVKIDYFPPLGDRKVAWDYIAFRGFLNTQMSIQFSWCGADSVLAAPLVLDLIRLVHFAKTRNKYGVISELGLYFKSPMGGGPSNLHEQYTILRDWIKDLK